ncbi:MAG: polysaccharide deacetylase family protein [Parcubacteria group bacterium]|nr:polysaccharide deacetylase family protein [Parcubacteria group bacterium]MBI3074929.1 polysaccharide deacetylase family protein [Parcubacteria group bacterium]
MKKRARSPLFIWLVSVGAVIFMMNGSPHVRAHEVPQPDAVKVPIFIYHSVRPYFPGESSLQDEYDITPELFEKHLIYLRDNGYTTVTLDELAGFIERKTTAPVAKPVILSFDDGWENQYRFAFPLLKKYGMTATFYIYTNPIGKEPYLSWNQIRDMAAAGMTIASHTLSHRPLHLLSPAELAKELRESKRILEMKLGIPISHFATPFGYTGAKIMKAVKEAGYTTCRTAYDGVYHSATDLLKLHGNQTTDYFADFVEVLRQ